MVPDSRSDPYRIHQVPCKHKAYPYQFRSSSKRIRSRVNAALIINLYYADNDQAGQQVTFAKLESLLESFDIKEDCKIILGGDFNVIFDKHLDTDGGSPCLKVGTNQKLMDILSEYDLCNIFRVRNHKLRRFAWRQKLCLYSVALTIFSYPANSRRMCQKSISTIL